MPVTPAEAQEFFQQVAAAGSPEEQQALIQDYAANNDNPDEMLAAVVQANDLISIIKSEDGNLFIKPV